MKKVIICEVCGKKVTRDVPNKETHGRYCSKSCAAVVRNRELRKGIERPCLWCGKMIYAQPSKVSTRRSIFCSMSCRGKFQGKGTRTLALDGYYVVRKNSKLVKEHRWVMEQKLGRPLERNEHVHHINCDKLDNREENLLLVDAVTHAKIHASLERVIRTLMKAGVVKFDNGQYQPVAA